MEVRKLIATTATAAVLAGGGLTVAALNPLAAVGAAEEQPAASAGGGDAVARAPEAGAPRRHRLHRLRRVVVEVAADAIGIPPGQLVSSLRQGSSIAQVAEGNGVVPQEVVDALVAAGTERVERALADGRIDEDRAARILDRLPEMMAKVVDRVPRTPRPND